MNCVTVKPRSNVMSNSFDNLFEDLFRMPAFKGVDTERSYSPKVDIKETDNSINLRFELPGMNKDDIKVLIRDDQLTVSGEKKFQKEEKDDNYVRRELSTGSFSRSFTLPDTVERDKIEADYKNGLLDLTLLKREELKPKEIKVKIS